MSWRQECKSTIRNSYQILSRGEPNLENELWRVSAAVINGTHDPRTGWTGNPGWPGYVVQAPANKTLSKALNIW